MKKAAQLLLFVCMGGTLMAQAVKQDFGESHYKAPDDELVNKKIAEWKDLKFGLFMHWGTYSQWGIVESWTLSPEDYAFCKRTGPHAANYFEYKKAYENLQATFNPVKFDPQKWSKAAADAGMKYVVFTTKHHDGFCMYDTKYTDYRITSPNTPFSKNPRADVTKQVFDAFRKDNFMVGAYFSKPDWHSDDFWWSYFPPKDRHQNYDITKFPEKWKRFSTFTYNQLQELMTGYGSVDLLWLDGDWAKLDMKPMVDMARQNQPGIIIVDRHGKPEYVNYLTPEQKIPDHYIPVPWETCMTMGKSWSYIPNEVYKPARRLIQLLVDIVAKNGNFLLDIGPGPDGEWHQEAYDRMKEIGAWMKVNGESIYGTTPVAPYRKDKWAFVSKANTLYASYLPAEGEQQLPATLDFIVPSMVKKNATISILGAKKSLKYKRSGDAVTVTIPDATRKQLQGQPVWVFKVQ